jgi:hypothetical protein
LPKKERSFEITTSNIDGKDREVKVSGEQIEQGKDILCHRSKEVNIQN